MERKKYLHRAYKEMVSRLSSLNLHVKLCLYYLLYDGITTLLCNLMIIQLNLNNLTLASFFFRS